jgi:predicted RNase H-like HicB family nuclease
MKQSARYIKIVEWSDEDQRFVGYCPGIIGPCCHGPDEAEVYRQVCEIVEEWIEIFNAEGRPLPPPTAGTNIGQCIGNPRLTPRFSPQCPTITTLPPSAATLPRLAVDRWNSVFQGVAELGTLPTWPTCEAVRQKGPTSRLVSTR